MPRAEAKPDLLTGIYRSVKSEEKVPLIFQLISQLVVQIMLLANSDTTISSSDEQRLSEKGRCSAGNVSLASKTDVTMEGTIAKPVESDDAKIELSRCTYVSYDSDD